MSSSVVLITGCSKGGIGHALCIELAKRGCIVYATSRKLATMEGLANETANIHVKELDVCDEKSMSRAVEEVITESGRIDIVISNAGVLEANPLLELSMDRVKRAYDTNVYGTLRLAQATIPHMASRRSGLFVFVSSISAFQPGPWCGVYNSTKAAVSAMARGLSLECRPLDVRVMLLEPGGVQSELSRNSLAGLALRENSLYKDYTESIMASIWEGDDGGMPTELFASRTVDVVLRKNPPFYQSIGTYAWLCWFFSFLPGWLVLDITWWKMGNPNEKVA